MWVNRDQRQVEGQFHLLALCIGIIEGVQVQDIIRLASVVNINVQPNLNLLSVPLWTILNLLLRFKPH